MKLIQITDIHFVPGKRLLHGLDPYERLRSCIADINTNHADADLCIITGDLEALDFDQVARFHITHVFPKPLYVETFSRAVQAFL